MVSVGFNITAKNDALRPMGMDELLSCLTNPDEKQVRRITQLRNIKELDRNAYKRMKVQLPYIVCARFEPAVRRTENFASTERFIIDIDSISSHGQDPDALFRSLCADRRVEMAFRSPGMDGIKLMMRLSERCFDAGVYSLFYKAFVRAFAQEHAISDMVDTSTSDVCRACFLSMDKETYYNPDAEPVCMSDYLPQEDDQAAFFDLEHEIMQAERSSQEEAAPVLRQSDPADEVMGRIKAVLCPRPARPAPQPVLVPQALEDVKSDVKKLVEHVGLQMCEMRNIQYGVKFVMKAGMRLAEVNLFYGKRGFSVVVSPRRGTCAELNGLVGEMLRQYFLQ